MNMYDVAKELSDRLGGLFKDRTTPYPPESLMPPAAYVFGSETEPHQSYGNGLTLLKLGVTVAVARIPADVCWKALAGYMSDAGPTSVRAWLESGTYTTFHTIVVKRSRVGDLTIAAVAYKGATFDLEITGSGA
jgi:hypothetical protein